MQCSNCGNALARAGAFCTKCGTQSQVMPNPVAMPSTGVAPKARKSKVPLLVVVCVVVIAALGGGVFFFLGDAIMGNYVDRVIAALENHDYTEAANLFNANRLGMDMNSLEDALMRRLDDLRNEFINETISYIAAATELETIGNFGLRRLEHQIEEVGRFIELLNDSRVAFSAANSLYERGDFIGAIDNFRLVSMDDDNFYFARDGINRAIEAYRVNALERAAGYAENGNLRQAVFVLDNALAVVGNDPELLERREIYSRQDISERIEAALALATAGDVSSAINELILLEMQNPGNTEVARALESVEISHVALIIERVNAYALANRFADATRELNDGLSLHPNNPALLTAVDELQARELDSYFARVNVLVANEQFSDAINLLENSRIADNNLVVQRIEEIEMMMPIPLLFAAPYFDKSPNAGSEAWTGIWFGDTAVMGAQEFSNPLNFRRSLGSAATQFTLHNLNDEFRVLRGYMGRADGTRMDNVTVRFLGDGIVLESFSLRAADIPMSFSVVVEGVQQLRIEVVFQADYFGNRRSNNHGSSTRYIIQGYLQR